jgi:superoxide dismutase, Fe-Mn family
MRGGDCCRPEHRVTLCAFWRRGSGWVILTYSARDNQLVNAWAQDHTTTVAGGVPLLVLDMYEHSYHIDFGAKAADYVAATMNAFNWSNADRLYATHGQS